MTSKSKAASSTVRKKRTIKNSAKRGTVSAKKARAAAREVSRNGKGR